MTKPENANGPDDGAVMAGADLGRIGTKYTNPQSSGQLQFTRFDSARTMTKVFSLRDGVLVKTAAADMTQGACERVAVGDLHELAVALDALNSGQAIAWGITPQDSPVVTADKVPDDKTAIARTREFFTFSSGPGVMMLDHDGAPNATFDADTLRDALIDVCPALAAAPMLWRPSASAGITDANGRILTGNTKHRLYIPVKDAKAITDAGKRLVSLLWARGRGWCEVSKAGSALERTLIDASVWQPERLDFAAPPILRDGLQRQSPEHRVYGDAPGMFDLALIELDEAAAKLASEQRRAAREAVKPKCMAAREAWAEEHAPMLAGERKIPVSEAKAVLIRASEHRVLMGNFMLIARDGTRVSVGEILDRPDHWHGQRFADPLGGDPHDSRIAWANLKSGTRPYLFSHDHGGQRFELRRQSARVQVGRGMRIDTTDNTLAVLRERGELFDFGEGAIAYVAEGRARAVGRDWLTDHMGRVSEYFSVKTKPDGAFVEIPEDAPPGVAMAIMAKHGERGFRKLTAVITAPTLRADGSILDVPGFDETSGLLYFQDQADAPRVPVLPSPADALAALRFLWKPFAEFPLVDDAARAVTLAAMLAATLRASLPTTPGFGFDAPSAGTGKTLLARCIGILATGNEPPILPPASEDEEMRKRLFAALREGSRVLLWDNVREPLGGAALDAFLTAPSFRDRVLGASETATLPNRALFLATGNNLRMTGDTCRRVLVARLDAQTERAYARDFDFDPAQYIASDHTRHVVAALTLVRAFIAAGRPKQALGRTATFEIWDDLVRQPICWLARLIAEAQGTSAADGLPMLTDPNNVIADSFEQDPQTAKQAALLKAWHANFNGDAMTVSKVIDFASRARGTLLDALEDIALQGRDLNRRILGAWIAKHAGQILGSLRFARIKDDRNGVAMWAVQRIATRPETTLLNPADPARWEKAA
ncbi:MAG: hypothetical protein JSR65_06610 [Proteobacteria bacterium]|nr:hypothetical protein [Pseudomonadota bacterium]